MPNHFTQIFFATKGDLLCSRSNGDLFTCENNLLITLRDRLLGVVIVVLRSRACHLISVIIT